MRARRCQPGTPRKGFTLIELMIVVAIIGILVAISVPSFMRFQCRAKQSEAKEMLKAIFIAELEYHAEHGNYVDLTALTSLGGLDNAGIAGTRYYQFTITPSGTSAFTAVAEDSRAPVASWGTVDQWQLSESDAQPLNTIARCTAAP